MDGYACTLFCDGVLTWREYFVMSIPFVFCFIGVAWMTYINEEIFVIITGGIVSLATGFLVALLTAIIYEMLPKLAIWFVLIMVVFAGGWILGKLANWIAWMKEEGRK